MLVVTALFANTRAKNWTSNRDQKTSVTQYSKRHFKDVLKMPYEDNQDISARCLSDA